MLKISNNPIGQNFLQIPGPSPVPNRVLHAISNPTIDHRGPEFGELGLKIIKDLKWVFQTKSEVVTFLSSGTGGWEAALTNVFDYGDEILFYETGHFSSIWAKMAANLGYKVEVISKSTKDLDGWRIGVDVELIEERLKKDLFKRIKGVCIVHNETSTGVISDIKSIREAIDVTNHPALLMVDTISGLGCAEYKHDDWGVDVSISGSQKGLMLPPGLAFNALSQKAISISQKNKYPKHYWDWGEILISNKNGYWPSTPNTNLLYGLHESLDMLKNEGLENVHKRHDKWASLVREAIKAWGMEIYCLNEKCYSPVLTAFVLPGNFDADHLRREIYNKFNLSLGAGLGKTVGRVVRLGHLGNINDLNIVAMITGVEIGMKNIGVDIENSGIERLVKIM